MEERQSVLITAASRGFGWALLDYYSFSGWRIVPLLRNAEIAERLGTDVPNFTSNHGLISGTDPVAVETVCLNIITEKRKSIRGDPWPLSSPLICVEAADKVNGLVTGRIENIKIEQDGWEHELLL